MQHFSVTEGGLFAQFQVRDNGVVELAHLVPEGTALAEPSLRDDVFHEILGVQETGKTTRDMHGYKHNVSSASLEYRYERHELIEGEPGKELRIYLRTPDGVQAIYHMQFFRGIPALQVWATLHNEGSLSHPLEYVSSFLYQNLSGEGRDPYYNKTDIYIPRNSWSCEAQWQKCDCRDLNLTGMSIDGYNMDGRGLNEYSYTGKSSWSTVNFLPMALTADRETGITSMFQIEHSGQWHIEYGSDFGGRLYIALSGATETEHGWWFDLKPGTSFTTVPVGLVVVKGGVNEAVAAMTQYRRAIRRPNTDDEKLNVVFNDYMNCLMGDPTEEKEKRIIDLAAQIGCEYYCMDCGWYDKGYWWDRVGEWIESPDRFPHGLRAVYEYARSKGLKMGMWLEIEVMGTACELSRKLPDDFFICRHGKRHIDNKRYLLDFRNPKVREYCTNVVDRLIEDYGCEYFKVDYNVTMGFGSDLNADSAAQSIRDHYEALYQWYRDLFQRHPDLVIENCGSGGQRMDYGMLKILSLQSTSDQTDYLWNAYMAANVASAVTPEQSGMWVYPYVDEREHVIFNFVNGLLHRPYVSGLVWDMKEESLALMKEGITLYKEIREELRQGVPYFPLGFCSTKENSFVAYGVRTEFAAYLAVLTPHSVQAKIPLDFGREIREVSVIYPASQDCEYKLEEGLLSVTMPQEACGRLFRIRF